MKKPFYASGYAGDIYDIGSFLCSENVCKYMMKKYENTVEEIKKKRDFFDDSYLNALNNGRYEDCIRYFCIEFLDYKEKTLKHIGPARVYYI